MKFLDLRFFILFMWGIVMLACISIIFIISPMSKHLIHEKNSIIILQTSLIQAILAMMIVGILIFILIKFQKIYLYKKLKAKKKN